MKHFKIIQKISKKKKEHRRKTNLEIWGNAARYRGSIEELDQELNLDDPSHGNAAKVKDLVEKLKSQTEKDRRKRQQRIEKKGKAYLLICRFRNKQKLLFPILTKKSNFTHTY